MKSCGLIVLSLLLFACGKKEEENKDQKPPFEIVALQPRQNDGPLKVLGSVSYWKKAEISSKILSRAEQILKEEGDRVVAGTPLAKMETLDLDIQVKKDLASLEVQQQQIQLAEAKHSLARQRVEKDVTAIARAEAELKDARASYENMKRTYDNKKKLHQIGAVSTSELKGIETSLVSSQTNMIKAEKALASVSVGYRDEDLEAAGRAVPQNPTEKKLAFVALNTQMEKAELDSAKSALKSIQANIDSTRLLLEQATIRSPIPGIVATRSIEKGEIPKDKEPVFIVVDTSSVLVRYTVNESDLKRITLGQVVKLTVDAFPDKTFTGKVHLISPLVDPQSRTAEVKVQAPNPNGLLKPGMFSRGEFVETTKQQAFFIPTRSIVPGKEKDKGYIFVVNPQGLMFKKPVLLGSASGESTEIMGDLKAGMLVAVGDVMSIQEGQPAPVAPPPKK